MQWKCKEQSSLDVGGMNMRCWQRMESKDWHHRVAVEGQSILYKVLWLSNDPWGKTDENNIKEWHLENKIAEALMLLMENHQLWHSQDRSTGGFVGEAIDGLKQTTNYGLGGLKHLWLLYVFRNDCPSISCFQSVWSKIPMYPLHVQGSRK